MNDVPNQPLIAPYEPRLAFSEVDRIMRLQATDVSLRGHQPKSRLGHNLPCRQPIKMHGLIRKSRRLVSQRNTHYISFAQTIPRITFPNSVDTFESSADDATPHVDASVMNGIYRESLIRHAKRKALGIARPRLKTHASYDPERTSLCHNVSSNRSGRHGDRPYDMLELQNMMMECLDFILPIPTIGQRSRRTQSETTETHRDQQSSPSSNYKEPWRMLVRYRKTQSRLLALRHLTLTLNPL